MFKLILKYLNKIKQLFVIIPVLIGIMVFIGLFFANKKSEPEFASKAERIMFEIKDKSPKYVMTLPDEQSEEEAITEEQKEEQKETQDEEAPAPRKTNNEKLSELDIPFIAKLPMRETTEVLDYIEPLENLLSEDESGIKLPQPDGLVKPWEAYGRRVNIMPMFKKVVVVIKNIGPNRGNADVISDRLPSDVSLSFSPYATDLVAQIKKARENGHETYLDMLLPSPDFSAADFGPQALNFMQSPEENIKLLEKQLSKNIAVGGFTIIDGIDDEAYNPYFQSIMTMLQQRGLLLFDATHGLTIGNNNVSGLDRVRADIIIDSDFERQNIRDKLALAEQQALRNGNVVIVSEPKPVAVLEIAAWLNTFSKQLSYEEMKTQNVTSFEKPLILVPLSNLAGEYE